MQRHTWVTVGCALLCLGLGFYARAVNPAEHDYYLFWWLGLDCLLALRYTRVVTVKAE